MSCEELFRKSLAEHGLRMTVQRESILTALHEYHKPVGVEEIYHRAKKSCSILDITTVYRTLNLLQEFGIVSVSEVNGKQYYQHLGLEKPHMHLICKSCGHIYSAPLEVAQPLINQMKDNMNFQIDLTEVNFHGLCEECQKKKRDL